MKTHRKRNGALTYEEAFEIAQQWSGNPTSVVAYHHPRLENAQHGRGFAFTHTISTDDGELDGYVLVTETTCASGLLGMFGLTINAVIAEHLTQADHDHREIADHELGAAQQLAVTAFDAGHTRISEMPEYPSNDVELVDYADYILLALRRWSRNGASARKILASEDSLMEPPRPGVRYTQPCPHCEQLMFYQPRYPREICGDCRDRISDRAGRRVIATNTSLLGTGMVAYYTDTDARVAGPGVEREECGEVTQSGVCFLDGHPATVREARFGGIVVELADTMSP
ncbi:hypothetical protein [Nocardia sp. NPDC058705]|uniref:hypothetical protein n=1 Tax=Nocardia sp. NPDC058705 TaxID=3346609 RepID=UPI00367AED71